MDQIMTFYPDGRPPEGRPLRDRVAGPDYRPLQRNPFSTPGGTGPEYLPSPPYLPQVYNDQPNPPHGIQPYPARPVYYAPAPPPTSGLGVASLVLGIIGACLVGLGPFGVLALIFGATALPAINRGERSGKGIAVGGLVLGIVQVVLWVILLVSIGAAGAYR